MEQNSRGCGCVLTCWGGGVFHLVCLYYLIDLPEQLSFVNECNYVIKNEVFLSLHLPSFQTEIAKRLNTICAQVIPFLSQEVSSCDCSRLHTLFAGSSSAGTILQRPTLSACFAASAAGGPSRGACKAGDHGGAQCGHRGTRTARSSTNRVYTFTLSFHTRSVSVSCV